MNRKGVGFTGILIVVAIIVIGYLAYTNNWLDKVKVPEVKTNLTNVYNTTFDNLNSTNFTKKEYQKVGVIYYTSERNCISNQDCNENMYQCNNSCICLEDGKCYVYQ